MKTRSINKLPLAAAVFALAVSFMVQPLFVRAQQNDEAQRVNELRRLRDQLQLTNGLRDADAVVILGERVLIEAAR